MGSPKQPSLLPRLQNFSPQTNKTDSKTPLMKTTAKQLTEHGVDAYMEPLLCVLASLVQEGTNTLGKKNVSINRAKTL